MSVKRQPLHIKHPVRFILVGILVLIVIVNGILTIHLLQKKTDNYQISYLIIRAVEQLNSPLVADPQTDNQYMPDARLFLPPPTASVGPVVYGFSAATKGFPEQVHSKCDRYS